MIKESKFSTAGSSSLNIIRNKDFDVNFLSFYSRIVISATVYGLAYMEGGVSMSLTNTTIVILGGSSGIGLATAKAAQVEGARVIITGRSAQRLQAAQAELGNAARTVVL